MKSQNRHAERGSALIYILIAIALLAALTITFMEPSSQQTTSQNSFKSTAELQGQIDTIRSAVQGCILRYPNGDQDTAIQSSDSGANQIYPLKPDSTYLKDPASNSNARNIRCPGNPQNGDPTDHGAIFASSTGQFLGAAPNLFGEWQWYNATDGVFFWIATSNSDAFLKSAMQKLDEKFGECEADFIDASSAAETMDSDGDITCPSGSMCFRVWMVTEDTAVFPDGSSCP